MARKKFSDEDLERITGATRHEDVPVPFYYAPPFLDQLREWIDSRLFSSGGRPTLDGAKVVRKVRFTKRNWKKLESIARSWSKQGSSVSPAQVATSIIEQALEPKKAALR
jgi:hypothetical protein